MFNTDASYRKLFATCKTILTTISSPHQKKMGVRLKTVLPAVFLILALSGAMIVVCGKRPSPESASPSAEGSLQADDEIVLQGKELYTSNGCESCHGPQGRGDGPAAVSLDPPPRTFQDIGSYKQGSSAGDIANTILTGIPGTVMAPYPHINPQDRRAISSYIVFLQSQP